MKALLVDDERHVQEAIHLLLDWPLYGVTEVLYADNGKEALDILIEDKISIMFCDMRMPVMDGVQLLEEVRRRKLNIQVIAVSGYDDFQYTRSAILANGVDYILKPFTRKSLEDAMSLAVSRLNGSFEVIKKEKDAEKANAILSSQTIGKWINGERCDAKSLASSQEKLGIAGKKLQLLVLLPINSRIVSEHQFEDDNELLYFSIRNIVYEILQECTLIEFLPVERNLWVILCMAENGQLISSSKEQQLIKSLQSALQLKCHCLPSSRLWDANQLPEALKVLKTELLRMAVVPDIASAIKHECPHFLEQEMIIKTALAHRNLDALNKAIDDLCAGLKNTGRVTLGQLQILTAEANLMYKRMYEQVKEQQIPVDEISPWVCDLEEWKNAVYGMFSSLTQGMEEESVNPQIIHHYLVENYNRNITLTDVAQHFHMSCQHLSRIYKSTYKTTIMSALIKLRVETAKSLLRTTDTAVNSIAQKLGYEDENYFSKVFKKQVGYSPKQYRRKYQP